MPRRPAPPGYAMPEVDAVDLPNARPLVAMRSPARIALEEHRAIDARITLATCDGGPTIGVVLGTQAVPCCHESA